MYQTTCIQIKNNQKELFNYCNDMTNLAKLFKNSVIFRCRQLLSAKNKNFINLNDNEKQVLEEFKLTEDKYNPITNKYYLPNYYHFVYMFTKTKNVDYYNNLPMQSNQQIIKEVLQDFNSFYKSIKDYSKNPNKYTGKPKLPKYIKVENTSFDITNQDCVIYKHKTNNTTNLNSNKETSYLKLPKTKVTINLGKLEINKLKEVTIKPYYNTYKICIVYEIDDTSNNKELDETRILGIDLGITNIVSTSNNCGLTPFVINGNGLKSFNQWFNKKHSLLQSKLPKNQYTSKRLEYLYQYRNNRTNDFYNKVASYIIYYCLHNNIGTIIIGKNIQWKTNINIGNKNNQTFCNIAHTQLINKLNQLSKKVGIVVMQIEESYTSKASFLDNDDIPSYTKNSNTNTSNLNYQFSGKRVCRGLYKTKNGIYINADVNGASNIIKKGNPLAFNNLDDLSYLYTSVNKILIK